MRDVIAKTWRCSTGWEQESPSCWTCDEPDESVGRAHVTGDPHRLQRLLVVGQIALSLLLVSTAGMLLRTYANLTRVDLGLDAEDVITFRVGAAWGEDRAALGQIQERLVAELERRPGVQAAGLANLLPATSGTQRYQVVVDGLAGPDPNGAMTTAIARSAPATSARGAW